MTIEKTDVGIALHQKKYIMTKLDKRDLLTGVTKGALPMTDEGRHRDERQAQDYKKKLQESQKEVGTLMWLAIKSRPDITACVSIASPTSLAIRRRPFEW